MSEYIKYIKGCVNDQSVGQNDGLLILEKNTREDLELHRLSEREEDGLQP